MSPTGGIFTFFDVHRFDFINTLGHGHPGTLNNLFINLGLSPNNVEKPSLLDNGGFRVTFVVTNSKKWSLWLIDFDLVTTHFQER